MKPAMIVPILFSVSLFIIGLFFSIKSVKKKRQAENALPEEEKNKLFFNKSVRYLVLSFLETAFCFAVIFFTPVYAQGPTWFKIVFPITSGVSFLWGGYYSHINVCKYIGNAKEKNVKTVTLFALTFIQYILFVYVFMYMATQFLMCMAYVVTQLIKLFKDEFQGFDKRKQIAYEVYDNGFTRTLKFVSSHPGDAFNNFQAYTRYRDDVGKFWRSYDDGQTFVKE